MLTRISLRRPGIVVGLWFLFTAALAPFAAHLPSDVKAGGFNDQHGAALVGQELDRAAFHDPANELAVVMHAPSAMTNTQVDAVKATARRLPGVTTVVDGRSRDGLVSHDRRTHVIVVGFSSDNTTTQNTVKPLRDALTDVGRRQHVDISVTGAPALDYDLNMQSSQDAQHAEFIAFPLLILVVLLVYRALIPTMLTLTVAGMSLAMTQGLGDLLARVIDVSNMYVTGASLIGLAVSVDYSLFVLKRHEEYVASGLSPREAITAATRTAGHAVRFGGTAVIAALCTLFIARNMVFSSIAIAGIVVTILAILLTSTFLPAAVALLGERALAGRLPRRRTPPDTPKTPGGLAAAFRAPRLLTAGLAAAFIALAAPLATLVLQVPVASATILPAEADSRRGIETMNAHLDSKVLFPTTVTITDPDLAGVLSATRAVTSAASASDDAASTTSATQFEETKVHSAIKSQGTFAPGDFPLVTKHADHYVSRVLVQAKGSPDSSSAHRLVHDLQDETAKLAHPAYVSGATAQGVDFDDLVASSIPKILIGVIALSLILLGFAFRSAWLPLIALGLNGIVVAGAMGTLTMLWRTITGESINSVTPIVMFAIIFGLSMDYMVLMANRMKEEFIRTGDHQAAIATGSARTSRLVTSAAVIMIAVFASFLVAKISIVRELGIGLAIAVLFDAFIVRPALMPAILSAVGERVWGRRPAQP